MSNTTTNRNTPTPTVKRCGATRRIQTLKPEILAAIAKKLDDGSFYRGNDVAAVEKRLQIMTRAGAVQATSSGTAALQLALMAAGIGPGDEVIVPVMTFISTSFAVNAVGATPVFVDVSKDTMTIDVEAATQAVTNKTRAVVPVHMHGLSADMDSICKLAKVHNLIVIEDAAQALGCQDSQGHHLGTIGDYGCVSLWSGKSAGGLGDAGAVLARDAKEKEKLCSLANLGRGPNDGKYNHQRYGIRARLSEIDGAVIQIELQRLDEWIGARTDIARRYDEAFADLIQRGVVLGGPRPNQNAYYKYALCLPTSTACLEEALQEAGIETERIYPNLVPDQEPYKNGELDHRIDGTLAHARDSIDKFTCLPIYPELTKNEQELVIDAVKKFFTSQQSTLPRTVSELTTNDAQSVVSSSSRNESIEDCSSSNNESSKRSKTIGSLKDESIKLYGGLAKEFESSQISRLGWSSRDSQQKRFHQLLRFIDMGTNSKDDGGSEVGRKKISILDVGCGVGDLYEFLTETSSIAARCDLEYVGCDIVAENVLEARKRFQCRATSSNGVVGGANPLHPKFLAMDILDINGKDGAQRYDYVVASGIFAVDGHDYDAAVLSILHKMLGLCERSVIVNFLSSHAIPEARLPRYHYVEPGRVARLAGEVTSSFSIHHDGYSHKKNDMTLVLHHPAIGRN